ncbi:MAG TPA: FGGY family carbohydrate kinase, partial [Niabella sp.]|nr:FGGY family carbohydrate kinase [Niabella sp.]
MNLIINLGLKSIRGIVLDNAGEQIYSKAYPVHTVLFKERVEQDAWEWLSLLENILREIADNTDLSHQIHYITATTSSSCILGINEQFLPETKTLMVSDKRAEKEAREIRQLESFRNIENTRNLVCTSSSLVPKALWFKKHHPETYQRVIYWFGAGELLNYYFTGEIFTDSLNASKAFYNGSAYEEALLKECGMNTATLPHVKEIGAVFEVKSDIKRKYKLSS